MRIFSHIWGDNLSGSGSILHQVQSALIKVGEEHKNIDGNDLLLQMEELKAHFPFFGLLRHFMNDLSRVIKPERSIEGRLLCDFVKNYKNKWSKAQEKAGDCMINSLEFDGKQILVHSNSSAIHTLFAQLQKQDIFPVLWQTYASPAGEGKVQAKTLSRLGFETHLIHENALNLFIKKMDMVIFGADMLTENYFVNKAGTFPITLLFAYYKKPVYVLAEQRKKFRLQDIPDLSMEKEKPASELLPEQIKNIRVHNLYFENTPLSLVNRVFLDE